MASDFFSPALGFDSRRALSLTARLGFACPRLRVAAGAVLSGLLLVAVSVSAYDWPQFLGPQRNGVFLS